MLKVPCDSVHMQHVQPQVPTRTLGSLDFLTWLVPIPPVSYSFILLLCSVLVSALQLPVFLFLIHGTTFYNASHMCSG